MHPYDLWPSVQWGPEYADMPHLALRPHNFRPAFCVWWVGT